MSRRQAIRANARPRWYEIRNEAGSSEPAQVLIYGDIGDSWWGDSIPASQFVRDLAEIDAEAIDFHIHSPGGDVFDGIAIATAIRNHKAHTVAYVDGLAASAASYIAIAADETVMAVGAEMMIHDAWGLCMGNAGDMAQMADDLGRISDNIASLYRLKAGGEVAEWRAAMLAETWYSADEAVAAGLADRVGSGAAQPAKDQAKAAFDLRVFAHQGRRDAPAPWLPAKARATHKPPAEPADTTTPMEGADTMSDKLIQGLRARLGVNADAALDEDGLLAALDEALSEGVQASTTTAPAGAVLVEESALADLRAMAADGAAARAHQIAAARTAIVDQAVTDGRIAPARREHWLNALNADHDGAAATLASLEKGLMVPVEPLGYTGGISEAADDDRAYPKSWLADEKKGGS